MVISGGQNSVIRHGLLQLLLLDCIVDTSIANSNMAQFKDLGRNHQVCMELYMTNDKAIDNVGDIVEWELMLQKYTVAHVTEG